MCGKSPRTLYFNAIIKDTHVNVVRDAVVTVNGGIGNDLVQSFRGIIDALQAIRSHTLNFLDFTHRDSKRLFNLIV